VSRSTRQETALPIPGWSSTAANGSSSRSRQSSSLNSLFAPPPAGQHGPKSDPCCIDHFLGARRNEASLVQHPFLAFSSLLGSTARRHSCIRPHKTKALEAAKSLGTDNMATSPRPPEVVGTRREKTIMRVFWSILNMLLDAPRGHGPCDYDRGARRRVEGFPTGTISSSPWEGWWHQEPIAGS
jgi:hypothetical protein